MLRANNSLVRSIYVFASFFLLFLFAPAALAVISEGEGMFAYENCFCQADDDCAGYLCINHVCSDNVTEEQLTDCSDRSYSRIKAGRIDTAIGVCACDSSAECVDDQFCNIVPSSRNFGTCVFKINEQPVENPERCKAAIEEAARKAAEEALKNMSCEERCDKTPETGDVEICLAACDVELMPEMAEDSEIMPVTEEEQEPTSIVEEMVAPEAEVEEEIGRIGETIDHAEEAVLEEGDGRSPRQVRSQCTLSCANSPYDYCLSSCCDTQCLLAVGSRTSVPFEDCMNICVGIVEDDGSVDDVIPMEPKASDMKPETKEEIPAEELIQCSTCDELYDDFYVENKCGACIDTAEGCAICNKAYDDYQDCLSRCDYSQNPGAHGSGAVSH